MRDNPPSLYIHENSLLPERNPPPHVINESEVNNQISQRKSQISGLIQSNMIDLVIQDRSCQTELILLKQIDPVKTDSSCQTNCQTRLVQREDSQIIKNERQTTY